MPTDALVVSPGTKFTASLDLGAGMTGLVGMLGVRIVDPGVQEVPVPRTTSGVSEFPAGSGIYGVELICPLPPGMYVVMWDITSGGAGPFTTSNSWGEQLYAAIEDPVFPGGWSWTPFGWLQPDWYEFNVSTGPPGSNPIPTAADVRAASKLDFCEYGYGSDTGPGGLQEIVDQAESMFWRITGQTLDEIAQHAPHSTTSPGAAPLVRRVITGMASHMCMQGASEQLDTQSDWELITNFSAGPYSETRRSPQDMFTGRMLFPVPWISLALWSLCTMERYGFWISFFTGVQLPAYQTQDVFWEAGLNLGNMYPASGPAGWWWGA